MKKRFISKLLMATLVVVTMGVFSSCKDYDDDINANSAEIQNLKSQVKTLEDAKAKLEADLASVNNTLNNSIKAAETKAAEDLKTAKTALEKAIADGDAEAVKQAQKLVEDAEARILDNAAKTAELKAQAAADAAKLEILNKLNEEVKALDDALKLRYTKEEIDNMLKDYVKSENFDKAVKELSDDITKLQNDLKANSDADAIIQGKMDEIYKRAIEGGDIDKAIAKVASDLSALDSKLNNLIDDDKAKENAGFATLVGLNQAWDQIRINDAAIKELQAYVDNFDKEVLPTLATMTYVQTEVANLRTELLAEIDKKASKDDLKKEIDAVYKTLEDYATQDWTTKKIKDAFDELKAFVESNYYTKKDVDDQVTILDGKIGAAKAEAFEYADELFGEVEGIVMAKINANNATLKREIYGEVEGMISKALSAALANYTNTTLMGILADYVKDADLGGKIDAKLEEYYNKKLAEKMQEISTISEKLAYMDEQFTILAEQLNQLTNFEIPADEEEATAEGRAKASATANSGIDALVEYLKALNDKFTNLHDYVDKTIKAVESNLDNISLYITKRLTSLVYRPEGENAYLYGFPTIKALLLQPQKTYEFNFTDNGDEVTLSDEESSKQFDIIAKYWLNPSSTDVSKYDWFFDEVAAKNIITRSDHNADKAGVSVGGYKVTDGGILEVSLAIADGSNVNNAKTDGGLAFGNRNEDGTYDSMETFAWITTVALQAVSKEVKEDETVELKDTVTSDYAIIVPEYYSNLVLANNIYESADHNMGNQKFHLWSENDRDNGYYSMLAENAKGVYSYKLTYTKEDELVDLKTIDVHYNGDEEVMSHADAEFRGFKFKYTILTDKEYFKFDPENQTISIADGKYVNTSVGKVANVRVELQADDKTFAYGYLSVVITSPTVDVDLKFAALKLNCNEDKSTWTTAANTVSVSIPWADAKQAIEDSIGYAGAFDDYTWKLEGAATAANLTKWDDGLKLGTISQDDDNLTWTFTEAEVYTLFYEDGKPTDKNLSYIATLKLTPKDEHTELSEVTITIELPEVVYPTGEFSYSQRIKGYWYKMFSTERTDVEAERYEIHANVETVDEPNADDKLFFNIADAFFNSKYGEAGFTDPNAILIYDKKGFSYSDFADVYFNADMYSDGVKTDAKYVYTGATGKYVLWLENADALVLKAAPYVDAEGKLVKLDAEGKPVKEGGSFDFTKSQDIVVLSGTYNNIATYQGWKYTTAGNPEKYAYAYDLLNKSGHDKMGENETFTTHMMLDRRDFCYPIDFTGNNAFKFDIRWMRPIKVNQAQKHYVYDAQDGGNQISLAANATFQDWRGVDFDFTTNHTNYIKYYGIRAIKPNFDEATTDLNGTDENGNWYNINRFPGLQFEDKTTTYNGDYRDFTIEKLGYIVYYNNGLNVGDFEIKLPVTVLYDWGETAQESITFVISKTKGQDIQARRQ